MNYEYQLRVCEIENLCGRQSRQAMRTNRCIRWLSEAEATDLTFCYFLASIQKILFLPSVMKFIRG